MGSLEASVFVHADTKIRTAAARWDKTLVCTLAFEGVTLFAAPLYGEDEVEGTLAALDLLAKSIEELREKVAGMAVAA